MWSQQQKINAPKVSKSGSGGNKCELKSFNSNSCRWCTEDYVNEKKISNNGYAQAIIKMPAIPPSRP